MQRYIEKIEKKIGFPILKVVGCKSMMHVNTSIFTKILWISKKGKIPEKIALARQNGLKSLF